MRTLEKKDVYHQPEDIPANLIIWQDENSGISALTQAAKDITEGKVVSFALCHREGAARPVIVEIVHLAMGSDAPRYCGENNDPNGAGSHALIPSWYDYCKEPEAIATALALAFKNYKHYFRLKGL